MRSRTFFAPVLLGALLFALPLLAEDAPSSDAMALGKSLYAEKCRDCHGRRAHRRALGKSKVLNTLETDEIIVKLREVQENRNPTTPQDIAKKGLGEDDIRSLDIYVRSFKRR